jgi:hypothetical protein
MEEDTVGACPALGCGNEVDPDERVGAHAGLRDGREQFAQYVQSCVDCEAGKEGGVLLYCEGVRYFKCALYGGDGVVVEALGCG